MKLIVHGLLCGVGATAPVILLGADPFLIATNVFTIVAACLTWNWCTDR